MISELDETIRQILLKEGGFDSAEVDVSFDLPNREWSGGISKPTLNCYLFDIRERRQLREEGWDLERRGTNGAARRRPALHFELTYLITAWTRAVEDEHRLLWHVLRTMLRFPILPTQHLQGMLAEYGWPIHANIAQTEGVLKSPGEFWSALENHLKPSLSYAVTVALDQEAIPAGPPVLTTSLRLRPTTHEAGTGAAEVQATKPALPHTMRVAIDERDIHVTDDEQGRLRLDGTLRGDQQQPLPDAIITVKGHNHRAITDSEGRFQLNGLLPGKYTLAIKMDGRTLRHALIVRHPSHQMIIDVGDRPGSLSDTPTEGGTTTS